MRRVLHNDCGCLRCEQNPPAMRSSSTTSRGAVDSSWVMSPNDATPAARCICFCSSLQWDSHRTGAAARTAARTMKKHRHEAICLQPSVQQQGANSWTHCLHVAKQSHLHGPSVSASTCRVERAEAAAGCPREQAESHVANFTVTSTAPALQLGCVQQQ